MKIAGLQSLFFSKSPLRKENRITMQCKTLSLSTALFFPPLAFSVLSRLKKVLGSSKFQVGIDPHLRLLRRRTSSALFLEYSMEETPMSSYKYLS